MTTIQVQAVGCAGTAITQKLLPYLADTCMKYNISTPAMQLCFLAQTSHESGGFFYTEELASGAAYEGRRDLGNIHPGDGVKYKGRGFIQITGRNNYDALSKALSIDFINNPSLLGARNINMCSPDQLKYAALSAGWFWNRCGLNDVANKIDIQKSIDEADNLEIFKEITRKINGGYNGLADRLNKYKQGLKQFITPTIINT